MQKCLVGLMILLGFVPAVQADDFLYDNDGYTNASFSPNTFMQVGRTSYELTQIDTYTNGSSVTWANSYLYNVGFYMRNADTLAIAFAQWDNSSQEFFGSITDDQGVANAYSVQYVNEQAGPAVKTWKQDSDGTGISLLQQNGFTVNFNGNVYNEGVSPDSEFETMPTGGSVAPGASVTHLEDFIVTFQRPLTTGYYFTSTLDSVEGGVSPAPEPFTIALGIAGLLAARRGVRRCSASGGRAN